MQNNINIPLTKQLQLVTRKGNRLATGIAALMGFPVPLFVYLFSHMIVFEFANLALWQVIALSTMTVGGCAFSAKSVYQWGAVAFADRWKAAGFTLLLEGVLLASGAFDTFLLWGLPVCRIAGGVALSYLMMINAVCCATNLVISDKAFYAEQRESSPKKSKRAKRKAAVTE